MTELRQNAQVASDRGLASNGLGLKKDDTFRISGLWDLVVPADRESYGLRLNDSSAGVTLTDDTIEIRVRGGGVAVIQMRRVDEIAGTVTTIDFDLLDTSPAHTQIALYLTKDSEASDAIRASYEYFDSGVAQGEIDLASTDIFHGEEFTRAQIRAQFDVIPEPGTMALLALGVAGLGFARRRRRANP